MSFVTSFPAEANIDDIASLQHKLTKQLEKGVQFRTKHKSRKFQKTINSGSSEIINCEDFSSKEIRDTAMFLFKIFTWQYFYSRYLRDIVHIQKFYVAVFLFKIFTWQCFYSKFLRCSVSIFS